MQRPTAARSGHIAVRSCQSIARGIAPILLFLTLPPVWPSDTENWYPSSVVLLSRPADEEARFRDLRAVVVADDCQIRNRVRRVGNAYLTSFMVALRKCKAKSIQSREKGWAICEWP